MLIESPFFKFLNRRDSVDFDEFLRVSIEDTDYINWNDRVLPQDYGDAKLEYQAIRENCALFDVTPLRKYEIGGAGAGEFLDHLLTRPVSDVPTGAIFAFHRVVSSGSYVLLRKKAHAP